mmetsp:Transcript_8194/g.36852  ORF Transcript_8194/g.36852 Transcript_8194/m.36852 type:complete len:222 (-) Transcript_8194:577-1242(-)
MRRECHVPLRDAYAVQVRPSQSNRLVVVDVEGSLDRHARRRRRWRDAVPKVGSLGGSGVQGQDVMRARIFAFAHGDDERETRPGSEHESLHVHVDRAVLDGADGHSAHLRGEATFFEFGEDHLAAGMRPRGDRHRGGLAGALPSELHSCGSISRFVSVGRRRHGDRDDAIGDVHAVVGARGTHEELALVGILRNHEREVCESRVLPGEISDAIALVIWGSE